jgi:signal transduction histidine kinase
MPTIKRPELARQITLWLVLYGFLLSTALFIHGLWVNEDAERRVWEATLERAMDAMLDQHVRVPSAHWPNTGKFDLYRLDGSPNVPEPLRPLAAGLHDELVFDDREWVVLVREVEGTRVALALDIEGFEAVEARLMRPVLISSLAFMLLMVVIIHGGARLIVRPISVLAREIGLLRPDRRGQRLELPARASAELEVIANALNDYLARNDRYVERERAFIDTASHELRTPVSVIRNAAQMARNQVDVPIASACQLDRILRTTGEVEELVSMLLVLAKDPARVRHGDERVDVQALLPEIVEDHRTLCEGRDLRLALGELPTCVLAAPETVLRVAIGNLLRNAIENSDRGTITIDLAANGHVVIRDCGHGMSEQEIAALYTRMAQGGDRRSGIGLELIARLGEHLGWKLSIESAKPQGTVVTLDLSGVRV